MIKSAAFKKILYKLISKYYYILQIYQHKHLIEFTYTTVVLVVTELFLPNVVLRMEVRWSISDTKDCDKVSNQYLSNIR